MGKLKSTLCAAIVILVWICKSMASGAISRNVELGGKAEGVGSVVVANRHAS